MAVAGQFPAHLRVAARTNVLLAKPKDDMPYRAVAMEVVLSGASQELVDLGGVPAPTGDPKIVDTMIEKSKIITPEDFYLTLSISQNAIDDDRTGSLFGKFKGVLPAFQRHINARVFTVLNAGDGATYGLCYDGQYMFDSDHVDPGAKYTTSQDNVSALTLGIDNFETVLVASKAFRDDQGNFSNLNYNLIVTSPALERTASQIVGNEWVYDTANREKNPYAGRSSYITAPEMDATAWVLVAANENTKPIFVGIRKRPQLLEIFYDSGAGEGGMYYIRYHGRYTVVYGDWRLAHLGNT